MLIIGGAGGVALVVALLAGLLVGRYLFPVSSGQDGEGGNAAKAAASLWTCSMHPQIRQNKPGDCPICGMDLVPVGQMGNDNGPRAMSMSESSRALAEIQTTEVRHDFPEVHVRLVGKLGYDETREKSLTARFPARIDELFVNYNGIRVKKGEHLAEVYSPELLTAQRELLTAHRSNPDSSITRAAFKKLLLWDLLPEQVDAILKTGEASDHFVLRAPIGGVVVSKHVSEGSYVKTGEPLFKIADLGELWLFLDAYESDLTWLHYGQKVNFTVEAFPGETFEGQIAFIEPEVHHLTRTVSIRVNVPNEDGRLKPGMFSRGIVDVKIADGGKAYAPEIAGKWISPMHPEIIKDGPGKCDRCGMDLVPVEELGYVGKEEEFAPLIIPASSVLRTGKRAVVYVQKPKTKRPTFEGREIVLGPRAGDSFIVKSGLKEGERVVSYGAFKIDSALQIQAKPSMMNPHGVGGTPPAAPIEISGELLPTLIKPYLDLQAALAADDLAASREAGKALMAGTGHDGPLPDLIHKMLAAESLDAMRKPHFETLSNSMITAAQAHPDTLGGELLIMHCPMVHDDRGADWLQSSEPLLNPYFGAKMLKCGDVKGKIPANDDPHEHQ